MILLLILLLVLVVVAKVVALVVDSVKELMMGWRKDDVGVKLYTNYPRGYPSDMMNS